MQSGFVCKLQASLLAQPMVEENKHDYEIKFTKRTLGSTKPSIISMKRAQDKNCCTWREKRCFDSFQHHTCGTQIGGMKEIWRRHILRPNSQLYTLVFRPTPCLASGFFVRVIQLEGAISPSGVPVFVALGRAESTSPSHQPGPWGGKFQVKILVPKNSILRWKNSKAKH